MLTIYFYSDSRKKRAKVCGLLCEIFRKKRYCKHIRVVSLQAEVVALSDLDCDASFFLVTHGPCRKDLKDIIATLKKRFPNKEINTLEVGVHQKSSAGK